MERKLDYQQYFDKVYGCWLGKCICGTIGAPYEGMKQYIPLEYSPKLFEEMLPNDDLDLQVLWLEGLEQKGVHITSDDLAALFSEKNVFWPGEYAWFKKNYDRDICPPYTGIYENDFYFEGMGCPIRGEIWGMIYPGNPDQAAQICQIDGTLDHHGNSVYFEQFWSSMVAASFFESSIPALLDIGMAHMPKESRAYALVRDVREWCDMEESTQRIMGRILAKYGHRDCTNSFQNIGVIVMALIKGKGDIVESTMMAVRQGFDTDCTAGNVGALLGAIIGAKRLDEEYGFKEAGYKLTLNYARKTDRVYDLAADTCRVGLHFVKEGKNPVVIEGAPQGWELKPKKEMDRITITARYEEEPYLQPGEEISIGIEIQNHTEQEYKGEVFLDPSCALTAVLEENTSSFSLAGKETLCLKMRVGLKKDLDCIGEKNAVTVRVVTEEGEISRRIGVIGKTPYRVYGPFWENIVNVPKLMPGESYYSKIPGTNEENYADNVRCYHLNTRIHPEKDYMTMEELTGTAKDGSFEKEGQIVFCKGDIVDFNQICAFDGQCAVYLKRVILCQEDQTVNLQIGHTDGFELWINGESLCRSSEVESWTPENVHLNGRTLKKGRNTVIVKLIKRSANAKFTMTFLTADKAPKHIVGFLSEVCPE